MLEIIAISIVAIPALLMVVILSFMVKGDPRTKGAKLRVLGKK